MAIYLDYNATTPVDPEVRDAISSSLKHDFGNPASAHVFGRAAAESVMRARQSVSALLGAGPGEGGAPGEVIFTSGGTESNNLALLGTARRLGRGHIVSSAIEHPSVLRTLEHIAAQEGFSVSYCPVGSDGRVIMEELERLLLKDTKLISIMHANNETGVLQPAEEIAGIATERGILFHMDAAQSAAKVPVDVNVLGAGMLTLASHKFYGPKGVGALYVKKGFEPAPITFGASQEGGLRPGTENVPLIAGLGKAAELARSDMERSARHSLELRDMLYEGLKADIPGLRLNGHETMRLPNTLNVSLPGADATALVSELGQSVAFSAGAACHAGKSSPSYVLKAMGLSDAEAMSSVRLSVGKYNTPEEIKEAVKTLSAAYYRLGRAR